MKFLSYFRNILQLILAPANGWIDIDADTHDLESVINKFLYPIIGVAALSVFVHLIYEPNPSLAGALLKALVTFVSLFATYYFALMMFKHFAFHLCEEDHPSEHSYTLVLAYSVALLALSTIICNIIPVKLGLKYLLPLAVALIMWKSDGYIGIRKDRNFPYFILCLGTVILPPALIQSIFETIL